MQLVFHASSLFEDDLARLSQGERNTVVGTINEVFHRIACEGEASCSLILKPEELKLRSGCCSSLSVLPVDADRSVIFAIDEDPIFDQLIISLIRVVSPDKVRAAYREAARWLYSLHTDESSPGLGDSRG